MTVFCDNCHKEIHRAIDTRNKHHYCDTECDTAWRKRSGFYKAISLMGKERRSEVVAVSNHLHPRRQRKEN